VTHVILSHSSHQMIKICQSIKFRNIIGTTNRVLFIALLIVPASELQYSKNCTDQHS